MRKYDEEDGLDLVKKAGFKIINKRVEIALKDYEGFAIWEKEQNIRISQKNFFLIIFWKNFSFPRYVALSFSSNLQTDLWYKLILFYRKFWIGIKKDY